MEDEPAPEDLGKLSADDEYWSHFGPIRPEDLIEGDDLMEDDQSDEELQRPGNEPAGDGLNQAQRKQSKAAALRRSAVKRVVSPYAVLI
jgi:hypothetical protein